MRAATVWDFGDGKSTAMGKPHYTMDDKAQWAWDHGGHMDNGIRDDHGRLMAIPHLTRVEDDDNDYDERGADSGSGGSLAAAVVTAAAVIGIAGIASMFSARREARRNEIALQERLAAETQHQQELRKFERSRMRQKMKRKLAEQRLQFEQEKLSMETDRRMAAERREQQAWQQVTEQRNLTEKILDQHEAQLRHDWQIQQQLLRSLEQEREMLLRQQEQMTSQLQILHDLLRTEAAQEATMRTTRVQIEMLMLSMQGVHARIEENHERYQQEQSLLLALESETK
ncbi:hypothetical protein [Bifidobacterium castoris]|nr:hypothetical protein [Bifidobacterium castoris]